MSYRKMIGFGTAIAIASLHAAEGGSGRDIHGKYVEKLRGFGDETVTITMLLINANMDTTVRRIKNIVLERPGSYDFSLIQFMDPPDVRGTGLLTHQNPKGDDKQWLYLPELRRVKIISSQNKTGSFMGSEFAFEDITSNTLEKFSYKEIGDADFEGMSCHLIEKTPLFGSGYTRIREWIDKDKGLLRRAEMYDRRNALFKVALNEEWRKTGNTWKSDKLTMSNLQTGKKTILVFSDRTQNKGLKETDFSESSMQRLRF